MDARDRLTNLAFFGAAGVVWILVALVVTTRDPRVDPAAGFIGAMLMGLAIGQETHALCWNNPRPGAQVARAALSYLWN